MAFSLKSVFGNFSSSPLLPGSAVGIDIGRGAVKVVELERTEDGPVLKTYGEIQIAPYAEQPIGSTVDFDVDTLEKVVVDVFREAGVQAQHGVVSLPLSAGFVTVVEITASPDENIEHRIPVEARKYVPIPLKEITLDWTLVGETQKTDKGMHRHRVLLVALPNETLLQYTQLLSSIELPNQPMELAIFSAARCLPPRLQSQTVALLDMGASVTTLTIYDASAVVAIHRFSAGGAMVTNKFAALIQIDIAAAETLKRSLVEGEPYSEELRRTNAAVFEGTLHEVRRILQTYEQNFAVESIPVVLTGGVSCGVGIPAFVSDMLHRQAEPLFPFATVGYPAFMEDVLKKIGPVFTSSLGAALRQIQ
jgi:type IV pilus assembly protein PilM